MKRPLRLGRSLPPISGRDITKQFFTCVERHREKLKKPRRNVHENSRSPSGSSGAGSDNPLELFSAEIRENIDIVDGQIRDLEREVMSGLNQKKFDSLAESIHASIQQTKEDMEEFETLSKERRRHGTSSDNRRSLQRMSNVMSNQIKSQAKKFKNVLLKHQEQISKSEQRLSSNRSGRPELRRRNRRGRRDPRERLMRAANRSNQQVETQELQHRQRNLNVTKWSQMINEISSMMTQMTEQLAEQGQMITRIEENVQDVNTNVEAGHGYLLEYLQGIQGNRSLVIKIFIFLICSLFFFVYFLRG